jgi:hypothetical protein
MILKRFNVRRSTDDPIVIERLKAEGYRPIKDYAEIPPLPEEPDPDLSGMTKAELVEIAKAKGMTGARSLTKAELLEVLS